jgi:hypothetical protein
MVVPGGMTVTLHVWWAGATLLPESGITNNICSRLDEMSIKISLVDGDGADLWQMVVIVTLHVWWAIAMLLW